MSTTLDVQALETMVKHMYRLVAQEPRGHFHFELGRKLALRLGYDTVQLAAVPRCWSCPSSRSTEGDGTGRVGRTRR